MADNLITDRDIEKLAQYLERERDDQAERVARERAERLSREGAPETAAIWSRVAAALV